MHKIIYIQTNENLPSWILHERMDTYWMKSEDLGVEALLEALSGIDWSAIFGTEFLLQEWGEGLNRLFLISVTPKGKPCSLLFSG